MTNREKQAINACASRLKYLASMQNCRFSGIHLTEAENERIKELIRPYMGWFDCVAESLEDIVKISEMAGEYNRTYKQIKLDEIIRHNDTNY